MAKSIRPRMAGGTVTRANHLGNAGQLWVFWWMYLNGEVSAFQSSAKKLVKIFFAVLFFAFFLADFLAPNFILGRGLEPDALGGRLRGGPLDVDFDAAAFLVVFLAVFRGDFRVVFLAGMVS